MWWSRNIPTLREHFSVYTIDLPGFAGNRTIRPFHLVEAISQISSRLRTYDQGRIAVMGHSLGGVVAAGIASSDPDLVDRLILVDAAFLSFEPGTVKHLRSLVREGLQLPAGLFPRVVQDLVRSGPTSFASGTYELVFHDWRHVLPGVKQPTMIVWGGKDRLVPLSVGESMQREIPNSVLEVIPDAGHVPMWSHSEQFNDLVSAFLNNLTHEHVNGLMAP